MRLKYYLRGLGIGILVTTIIMTIASPKKETALSDEEIIARAAQLGMVMAEDTENGATGDDNPDDGESGQGADDAQNPDDGTPDQGMDGVQSPDDAQNPDDGTPDQGMDGVQSPDDAQNPDGGEPAQGADGAQNPADGAQGADAQNPDGAQPDQGDAGQGADAPQNPGAQAADGGAQPESSYRLVIQPGDVCRTVCERLAANNVISDAEAMRTYLFEIGYASSMSTGEYEIPYGLSMEEVANLLKSGPIKY